MNIDELTIGELKKLQALVCCDTTEKKSCIQDEMRIVILQRGWVMVGRFYQDGHDCSLKDSAVIRTWGTTKGLPELIDGPTSSTKLDKCSGTVRFHELTVIASIDVSYEKWKKVLC